MYNFEADVIPPFLPVREEVQLRPWFPRATLDAGLALIRERKIGAFHVLRGCVGACIEHGATVTLQFEASTKLSQGFVLCNNHCGLCGYAAQRTRCAHMAALAILCLSAGSGQLQPKPIALAFAESYWAKIGEYLHEWLSRGKYSVDIGDQGNIHRWRICARCLPSACRGCWAVSGSLPGSMCNPSPNQRAVW